ncbi:MAG: aminodeoxychorismate lyase, partial [Actinomycetes bacterium]
HLDRLAGSAAALDLVLPSEQEWRRAITRAVAQHRSQHPPASAAADELVVKLVVTRGVEGASAPTAWVQASPVGAGA